MRGRTKSRARVLQVLYAWEMRGAADPLREIDHGLGEPCKKSLEPRVSEHAYRLLDSIQSHQSDIDARIEALSDNWRLSRMTVIDRNILRIATAEMLYCGEIPLRVSVHEAIRLADWFGTEESRRFINGVLDALLHSLEPENLPPPDAR